MVSIFSEIRRVQNILLQTLPAASLTRRRKRLNRGYALQPVSGTSLGSSPQALEDRTLLAAGFPEFIDPNPSQGNGFGTTVLPLSTGNVVITAPGDDAGGLDAGAVYLFNGANGQLISTLLGADDYDAIGSGGVSELTNGNFVISSPEWDNGSVVNVGAVTFGSGTTGISGVVSAANSLVGSTSQDRVGSTDVTPLTNGNYLVVSKGWSNGAIVNAGAVTFGNGSTGVRGPVSATNSLVGTKANDLVGLDGIVVLPNGNYLVVSSAWNRNSVPQVGAVTFGNGVTGTVGSVSSSNSLVGSTTYDSVGEDGVTVLSNGNYVVASASWDNGLAADAGAVTFGSGVSGISGVVSASNSLVGTASDDLVGVYRTIALPNGNYLVSSPFWDNDGIIDAGAVTFCDGTTGRTGSVSVLNSLVGSSNGDTIGSADRVVLANSNYVVCSPYWDRGTVVNAGAATFGSGTNGVTGVVSALNSLVGSTAEDQIAASGAVPLSNGNYVVQSPWWNNGLVTSAGAVTFGNGTTGIVGAVSVFNSLVGTTAYDSIGGVGVKPLTNGHYVVASPLWDNGSDENAGAATFGNGNTGVNGPVSTGNSLFGSAFDYVATRIVALANGNYVVSSPDWNNGAEISAGAVTLGSGVAGTVGRVSESNSLVGQQSNDFVGQAVYALSNGNYVVTSPDWDNGTTTNAGAVTFSNGASGITGRVSQANSLVGIATEDRLGRSGVDVFPNGNYVVSGNLTFSVSGASYGSFTFGSGTAGVHGIVNATNTLFTNAFSGSSISIDPQNEAFYVSIPQQDGYDSQVHRGSMTEGFHRSLSSWFNDPNPRPDNYFGDTILPLMNGNVVVTSPGDDSAGLDAGAVYLFSGSTRQLISTLTGGTVGDRIGSGGVFELGTGNYLIASPHFSHNAMPEAGAVTLGNALTGVQAVVSSQNSLVGTSTSDGVGERIEVLKGGNFLVITPGWDHGSAVDAGAVTFGHGTSGVRGVVSVQNSLVGETSEDRVGSSTQILPNGNYVVQSPAWDRAGLTDVGAVTFGNGVSGVTGGINGNNSLMGNALGDHVGSTVIVLKNGNYLALSPMADHGAVTDAGAVTFGSGATGVVGALSTLNSLMGPTANDQIGRGDSIRELTNGNAVLLSPMWDNGGAVDAGAVTFVNGISGLTGFVSPANSLTGSHSYDGLGADPNRLFATLPNGNYVITAPEWDSATAVNAGSVTLCNGLTGTTGSISEASSLIGSSTDDRIGAWYYGLGVTVLQNGNYVVYSGSWDSASVIDAGAVTLCSGSTPTTGRISATNSLVGSREGDLHFVQKPVTPLTNGNYVVVVPTWNGDRGAVTLGHGERGIVGEITGSNSLIGSMPSDSIGMRDNFTGVTELRNGNYVVVSTRWNGARGAVTFGHGELGVTGVVSVQNSLVGSTVYDRVGLGGISALKNGNYVILSPGWNGGSANYYFGAATFGSGNLGVAGVVSAQNSFVGSFELDQVGKSTVELANGNVLIVSPNWYGKPGQPFGNVRNGMGAVTFMNGTSGGSGVVSAANSLVGSTPEDSIGAPSYLFNSYLSYGGTVALPNGNYVVFSPGWDNGNIVNAGAITVGNGAVGTFGVVGLGNSLTGFRSNQLVGLENPVVLSDSRFYVSSGDIYFGNGETGISGPVSPENSLRNPSNYLTTVRLRNEDYLIKYGDGAFLWSASTLPTGSVKDINSIYRSSRTLWFSNLVFNNESVVYGAYDGGIFIGTVEDGFLPRINPIPDVVIKEDAPEQTVNLAGIFPGWGQGRPLRLTAASSNPGLIANAVVNYTSPNSTGTLKFKPTALKTGTTTMTLTLEDGGPDGNLATSEDNAFNTRSFSVSVEAIRPTLLGPVGNITQQRPRLEWTAVPGAVKYEVWIKNATTGLNPFHKGEATGTFYQFPMDLGVGKMDVWVRAVTGSGAALPWSQLHRFTVITAPTLAPLDSRQTTARPVFSWNILYGASSWDIWVSNLTAGGTQAVRTTSAVASWSPGTDLPMARYRIWVRALGAGRFAGAWSAAKDFYVASSPSPVTPLLPTFSKRPSFDWTDVAGATSYGIYLQNTGTGAVVTNVSGLSTSTWTPQVDLPDGSYAWWSIADSNTAGFRGSWSVRTEFYVGGRTTITAPGATVTSTTPLLQWLAVDGAVRYELWVNGDVEGAKLIHQTSLITNSFQVTAPLGRGRTYRMWVRAVSSSGQTSPWSNVRDFTVAHADGALTDETGGGLPPVSIPGVIPDALLSDRPWRMRQDQPSGNAEASAMPLAEAAVGTHSETPAEVADSWHRQTDATAMSDSDALMGVFAAVSGANWLDNLLHASASCTDLVENAYQT